MTKHVNDLFDIFLRRINPNSFCPSIVGTICRVAALTVYVYHRMFIYVLFKSDLYHVVILDEIILFLKVTAHLMIACCITLYFNLVSIKTVIVKIYVSLHRLI